MVENRGSDFSIFSHYLRNIAPFFLLVQLLSNEYRQAGGIGRLIEIDPVIVQHGGEQPHSKQGQAVQDDGAASYFFTVSSPVYVFSIPSEKYRLGKSNFQGLGLHRISQ